MQVYKALDQVPADFGPTAVTIGKFDGVHTGHRRVIGELRELAGVHGLTSAVVTFDRNPLSIIKPEVSPEPLVSVKQKLELIEQLGVDTALVLEFDEKFSEISPEQFVRTILVDALHASVVLVGSDFRFGAKGNGDVDVLRELGTRYGFTVHIVADVIAEGRRASSTWIRELLAVGKVSEAAELLGYLPTVRAVVVHGAQRGRELGFPTANLAQDVEGFVPEDGVYAAWATIGEDRFAAAVSVGKNPTFEGVLQTQVEAHLLDQDLDLYGRVIEVAFVEWVRGMVKFEGIEPLIVQMNDDLTRVRTVLGGPPRL
ncbi:bifunctional riboflavin kinase/FAD synthetase [Glaciihabitans sp. dw_435]|uniref:bifunctional riboflavin kinase/FAD synthetase n=1 Tax=Glaciihabitans sp. dw_435 TaxID=2720081 RepID=UPI001BD5BF8B|nr:bifunctional riboflavin kinase/FAD synthetase [Glaciihabitans sp. dw_435]